MDFLIDLIPALPFLLIAFIDIYLATKLAMVLAAVQLIISRLYYKRLKRMHLVTFAAIMIFGSLTLALHDDRFIVFKPTVLNWILGLCFLVAPLILKKNLLKTMLDDKLAMPDRAWASLNLMWVGYFFVIGAANLYVALAYSREVWGPAHLFVTYGALVLFMVIQGFYVYRHMQHEPAQAPVAGGGGDAP